MIIMKYVANFIVFLIVLFSSSCVKESPIERVQFLMGTYGRIVVYNGTNEDVDKAFSKIKYLEDMMSDYNPDSEISEINRNAGKKSVEVSEELIMVLGLALEVARETGGAFDPTIGALTIGLYGFGRDKVNVHHVEDIDRTKALVDYNLLRLNGNKVFVEKEGMMVDLGGIGKGHAVDKAVDVLRRRGVTKGSVSISGDLRIFGKDQEVNIKHPRKEGIVASFRSGGKDLAISTSGDYQRYIEEKGRVYNHILIPKTGKSGADFQSITLVMEGNNALADAYATALFALGRENALKFLKDHPEIGVFIVYSCGEIFVNKTFKELVTDFKLYS